MIDDKNLAKCEVFVIMQIHFYQKSLNFWFTSIVLSVGNITISVTNVKGLAIQGGITFESLIATHFTLLAKYVKNCYGNEKLYYLYGKAIGVNMIV